MHFEKPYRNHHLPPLALPFLFATPSSPLPLHLHFLHLLVSLAVLLGGLELLRLALPLRAALLLRLLLRELLVLTERDGADKHSNGEDLKGDATAHAFRLTHHVTAEQGDEAYDGRCEDLCR